jgi:hypothetical protein
MRAVLKVMRTSALEAEGGNKARYVILLLPRPLISDQ